MNFHPLKFQVDQLNAMARKRLAGLNEAEGRRLAEIDQMLRLGLCPCILQGRYSTCCATKLGDLK